MARRLRPVSSRYALTVALVYAVVSGLWIVASDFLIQPLEETLAWGGWLEMGKGLLFVAVTGFLLYLLLRHAPIPVSDAEAGALPPPRNNTPAYVPYLAFALLAGIIAAAGYLVFDRHRGEMKAAKYNELAAIADLKVGQIRSWLNERRGDAAILQSSPFLTEAVENWLLKDNEAERQDLLSRLRITKDVHGYSGVALFDDRLRPLLATGALFALTEEEEGAAVAAMRLGKVVMVDFHQVGAGGEIELEIFAPLRSKRSGRDVGVVQLRIDPRKFLFPLVQSWPVPSASAESLLVEREGDEALYLNQLRHYPGPGLQLRVPLSREDLPTVMAIQGREGMVEGRDYRGVPVLAALRHIPDSPWYLEAKIDQREMLAPINRLAWITAALVAVFVAAAAAMVWLWWRRQRDSFLLRQTQAEMERRLLTRRLDLLSRHANDAIFVTDDSGVVFDANERAESLYGYSREEILGLDVRALRIPKERQRLEEDWRKAEASKEGSIFETVHLRKDGRAFPVEISLRTLDQDGVRLHVGVVRDISERREAETRIRRLTDLYAALSMCNEAIVRLHDRDELFREVCRIAVERGGFRFAWIGLPDPATGWVRVAASSGDDRGYLASLRVSTNAAIPEGQGPTGTAIREGRSYVVNDYAMDPHTAPWRASLAERGVHAAGVFPFFVGGKPAGALTLYAGAEHYFDPQLIQLLEEMASDLSFALDGLESEFRRVQAEEAMQKGLQRLHALLDNIPDMAWLKDREGRFIAANERFAEACGVPASQVPGKTDLDLWPPDLARAYLADDDEVMRSGRRKRVEEELLDAAGRKSWIETIKTPIVNEQGEIIGTAGIARDITERKLADEALKASEERFRAIFDSVSDAIFVQELANGAIVDVNRRVSELYGYSREEALRLSVEDLSAGSPPYTQKEALALIDKAAAGEPQTFEWRAKRKDGSLFWVEVSMNLATIGGAERLLVSVRDIDARKRAEEQVRHLSYYDALTDLPNQFLLRDRIGQALAHAKRLQCFVALLVVNLDRFRSVNERFGRQAGDQVLKIISQRLAVLMREGDTVARIGADNFAIVMPDLQDKSHVKVVASKVLEAVAEPVFFNRYELHLSARVGVTVYPTDGESPETLMKNADIALANAKLIDTHNYAFYSHEQGRELEERAAMETALHHAIERGELLLHYQPRIDMVNGEIVAMEALLRWQHPQQGLLLPGKFIDLAEQTGLILPIGEWALREACMQAKRWHEAGFVKLRMAVNVSVLQLRQRRLLEVVRGVLEATDVHPALLELEFTESFLMEDAEETADILRGLRDIGLHFAVDDFGTGYSSLGYLKLFPVDLLKIDQSFVRDIAFDPANAAIVRGMIALGHSLGLRMVAEGVETEAQMAYLRSIHCDEMQGFFYSRALPAAEALGLLQSSKRLQDIAQTPGATRKLLIVDDEPNITTALNRLLRREGYQILTAGSGREALEILAVNSDVGVVLSDQRMPEMSGIELLSKIKVLYPDIIRIVLSGYTEVSTITEAVNKGAIYKFLTKPWEDEELREVVRKAFVHYELGKAEQERNS
jgi:diguanylate cyclase (GGDEF)-like protein/PAS domain S-box-containing protein